VLLVRAALILLLLAITSGAAYAQSLGNLRLPEGIAPLPADAPVQLLNPPAASDAWAMPGHRPLGVTLSNYDLTQQQIEAVVATGCGLVRLHIPMEHFLDDHSADWAVLDQVISRLKRSDLEVLAVLDSQTPVREFYRPFCKRIAARYCESLRYYQLLDNINYKLGLSSRDYADLLAVCRPDMVTVDQDAVIVAGAMRGCDLTYLDMLEQQHALRNIDVLALTLFPPKGGIERTNWEIRGEHCLPVVEQVVQWARQRGKRVWVTSFGVSTDSTWVGVDEVAQGSMYARGALVLGAMGVERVLFAQVQDNDPTYQIPAMCCGLLHVDGSPKASFHALRALNGVVQGAFHAVVPFSYSAQTFQRPREQDIRGLREDQMEYSRRIFTGQASIADSAFGLQGPLDTFRLHDVAVFSFWFYAPAAKEYRLIYWLVDEQPWPALLTLTCENARLLPFEEHLRPLRVYHVLETQPRKADYFSAKNMVFLPYLALDTVPAVVAFGASDRPAPSPTAAESFKSVLQPDTPVPAFRR
jgi:hypothetical protein